MIQELSEGVYIIPVQFRGIIVRGNEIHIFPRTKTTLKEYRCKDCKYRQLGPATINAWHESMICTQRPKQILNPKFKSKKIFYAAPYYGKPCEHFKLKGGNHEPK